LPANYVVRCHLTRTFMNNRTNVSCSHEKNKAKERWKMYQKGIIKTPTASMVWQLCGGEYALHFEHIHVRTCQEKHGGGGAGGSKAKL
jgi:hypothetical protein